jgi:hypothetical protein
VAVRTYAAPFLIGLAGATTAGVLFHDLWYLGLAIIVVGAATAWVAIAASIPLNRVAATGLGIGVAASLGVLMAIQFLITVNTVINGESLSELLGFAPLVALIWGSYVVAGEIGFGAIALARRLTSDRAG